MQRASGANLILHSNGDTRLCDVVSLWGFIQSEIIGLQLIEAIGLLHFDLLLDIRACITIVNVDRKRLSGAIDHTKNFERA